MKTLFLSVAILATSTSSTIISAQEFLSEQFHIVQQPRFQAFVPQDETQALTNAQLRDIDRLVVALADYTTELHHEYHEHLAGVRYAEILDEDVTELEEIAEALHQLVRNAPGGDPQATRQIQKYTNDFLQLAFRIPRTMDLTEPWLRTGEARIGIRHMRSAAAEINRIVAQIDRYLPIDETIMDDQAHVLEEAVKELHDEFHEHLEGYEYSRHTDEDLEELEEFVEHMHELAHGRLFSQIDLSHLREDIQEVRQSSLHIDQLLVRQSQVGVRTLDWVGIQHSRDAVSDVWASANLLEHMINKASGFGHPRYRGHRPTRDRLTRDRLRSRDH